MLHSPIYPDHNYSLPKNSFTNFRTTSSDDFVPVPSKILSIPRSVFVNVPSGNPIRANLQGYSRASPLHFQKTTSSDDFRKSGHSIRTYHPRRVFVESKGSTITRVINPVSGLRANETVQNQTSNNQSVRSGFKATPTRDNSLATNLSVQKPSVTFTRSSNSNLVQNIKPKLVEQMKKSTVISQAPRSHSNRLKRGVNGPPQNYVQQKRINAQQNRLYKPTNPILVSPPLMKTSAVVTTTTTAAPVTDTVSSSPTNSNLQQSPLQRQIRSYMDHLHFLQAKMKTQPDTGQVPPAPTIASSPVSFNNSTNSASPAVLKKGGPRPTSLAGPKPNSTLLHAARNLSDFNKALQKLSAGFGTTTAVPNPVASTSSINPAGSFMVPRQKDKLVPSARLQINGIPVTRLASPGVARHSSPKGVKRLVNRAVPISPGGYRRVIITPRNGVAQNPSPVRVVPAKPSGNPLQRKMVANLNKLAMGVPTTTQPRSQLKNGLSLKSHQTTKKNGQSLRPNSLSVSPSAAASKSNKENIKKRRLSQRATNNAKIAASIDLSKEDDSGGGSRGSLSQEVVDTLKKNGISINSVEPSTETGVIKLD